MRVTVIKVVVRACERPQLVRQQWSSGTWRYVYATANMCSMREMRRCMYVYVYVCGRGGRRRPRRMWRSRRHLGDVVTRRRVASSVEHRASDQSRIYAMRYAILRPTAIDPNGSRCEHQEDPTPRETLQTHDSRGAKNAWTHYTSSIPTQTPTRHTRPHTDSPRRPPSRSPTTRGHTATLAGTPASRSPQAGTVRAPGTRATLHRTRVQCPESAPKAKEKYAHELCTEPCLRYAGASKPISDSG